MSELPQQSKSKVSPTSESTPSGPIVVHFPSTPPSAANMGTISSRKGRRGRSNKLWIVGGLVVVVMIGMFLESKEQLETAENPLGQTDFKSNTEVQRHPSKTTMDVNAPPNSQQNSHSSDPNTQQTTSFWELADMGSTTSATTTRPPATTTAASKLSPKPQPNFSLFSWGQSDRFEEEVSAKASKTAKKHAKKNRIKTPAYERFNPIPVIDENDDRVPQAVAGSVLRAADALLCRESVIEYVINATDLKDECDGLKKAYTKNCGGDDEEATNAAARSRRRLKEASTFQGRSTKNPVIQWQQWLYRKTHFMRRYWLFQDPKALLVEDQILNEWNEARFETEMGWKLYSPHDIFLLDDNTTPATESPGDQRKLNEADEFSRAEKRLARKEMVAVEAESSNLDTPPPPLPLPPNKTVTVNKEKPKLSNLALPTNKQHVSDKMLSETLLLQQDDRLMAHVKAATNNGTANAVADAAKSTKAVSDTFDYISSVLNDPSSVEARTCCTSILNVFHENCSIDEDDELSDSRLFIVVAVIAVCGMVKSLIRHFQIRWLPEAAGCILVGVASGWVLSYYPHHDLSFDGHWFLRILLPPIVFEAALSIDKRSFNRHVVPILLYAIIGTLLSTGLTAFVVHQGSKYYHGYCETIPVVESLTFGALISSIDPIAVLSVLSNMGMTDTDTIYVVIFGESLLNDGVSIVLFQTLVHFLDVNMEVDSTAVSAASIHFLVVAIGSLLVGLVSGICCTVYYWAMHGCQTPLVEVLMFCCWALLPYYVCDGIEWSGIVAVVAAGFVMDTQVVGQECPPDDPMDMYAEQQQSSPRNSRRERKRRPIFSTEGHLSKEAKTHIGFVTEIIATMMETVIFAYLGLFLFSSRYHWNNYHTFIAIGACCVSRAIMIPSLSMMANWITQTQQVQANCRYQQLPQQQQQHEQDLSLGPKQSNPAGVIIDKKMQLVLWFAGLRGAMSFALVEDIPTYDTVTGEGTRLKSELKAMTSACIIFTVFVLGGLTYYMMDGLGMTPSHGKSVDSGSKSNLTKEMEMIGLLSASFSKKTGDEYDTTPPEESPTTFDYDKNDHTAEEMPNATRRTAAPSSGNMFRQRTQAY